MKDPDKLLQVVMTVCNDLGVTHVEANKKTLDHLFKNASIKPNGRQWLARENESVVDSEVMLYRKDHCICLVDCVTGKYKYMGQPDQAMRFNEGKLEWSLIDFEQLKGMVQVLMFGCHKYDRDNWKKGLPMRSQCDSMMRHLTAIMNGEVKDPETGLYHWDHIMCNAMFMSHTYQNHPHHIDLPKPPTKSNQQ